MNRYHGYSNYGDNDSILGLVLLFRIKLKKFNAIYNSEINAMTPDKVEYLTIQERQKIKKSVKKALSNVHKFQQFLITDDNQKKIELVESILTKIRNVERMEKNEAERSKNDLK
jgi:altronate dehydratase